MRKLKSCNAVENKIKEKAHRKQKETEAKDGVTQAFYMVTRVQYLCMCV